MTGEPERDVLDDPALQAERDQLAPFGCGACGVEVLGSPMIPDHFPWCPLYPTDQ